MDVVAVQVIGLRRDPKEPPLAGSAAMHDRLRPPRLTPWGLRCA